MTNLKTTHQELANFISSRINIDAWDLDAPDDYLSNTYEGKQACTAISYPAQSLQYSRVGTSGLEGEATLDFSITYRYPSELREDELPHQDFQAIVEYLLAASLMEVGGCGSINAIAPNEVEFPIFIKRESELGNDWLVILNLSYRVRFRVTEIGIPDIYGPGADDTYEPYTPQQLTLGIYRSKVGDLDDNVLDTEFILTND